jgi:anti-sigma factor RsiW
MAIARARMDGLTGAASRRRRLWAAVTAAGLLAGGTWVGLQAISGHDLIVPDPLAAVAEDHLRAQRHMGLASTDSLEVARWLGERVPFPVAVPLFPGTQMTGARLLLANGQSGAVIDYLIAGRRLSYYVIPVPQGNASSAMEGIQVSARTGYRIAAWEDGGLTHALVAGLSGPKLVELAHYCIEQTSGRQLL